MDTSADEVPQKADGRAGVRKRPQDGGLLVTAETHELAMAEIAKLENDVVKRGKKRAPPGERKKKKAPLSDDRVNEKDMADGDDMGENSGAMV